MKFDSCFDLRENHRDKFRTLCCGEKKVCMFVISLRCLTTRKNRPPSLSFSRLLMCPPSSAHFFFSLLSSLDKCFCSSRVCGEDGVFLQLVPYVGHFRQLACTYFLVFLWMIEFAGGAVYSKSTLRKPSLEHGNPFWSRSLPLSEISREVPF